MSEYCLFSKRQWQRINSKTEEKALAGMRELKTKVSSKRKLVENAMDEININAAEIMRKRVLILTYDIRTIKKKAALLIDDIRGNQPEKASTMNISNLIKGVFPEGKLFATACILIAISVSACQTLPPEPRPRIEIPEIKSIKDVTEYVEISLKDESYSIDTLLMLTEDYFAESAENTQDALLGLRERKKVLPVRLGKEEPPLPDHEKFVKGLTALLDKYPKKTGRR